MRKALFAGSFDPFTNGHFDILKQASEIFDEVIVAVAFNSEKKSFLPLEKRLELIKRAVKDLTNVCVDSYEGLTVEYAQKNNVNILVRGIRNSSDLEYEMQILNINSKLAPEVKTIFLSPKPEYSYISSTIVREVYINGGNISGLVPYVWK